MAIYNIIHTLMHYISGSSSETSDGKTNSRTVLIGTILWCVVWVMMYTLRDNYFFPVLRNVFIVVVFADICTMAYIYKSYYGRSIINEIGQEEEWKYDYKGKKFTRKDEYDRYINDINRQNDIDIELSNLSKSNVAKIKAAEYIQQWWMTQRKNS
jgi:hypothetical protein